MSRTKTNYPGKKEIKIRKQVQEIEEFIKLRQEHPVQLGFTINKAFIGEEWNQAKARVQQKAMDEMEKIIRKMSEEKGIPLNE